MKTARLLWHLIRYRPVSYACQPFFVLVCYCERIVFGLVVQAFFNALPIQTQMTPALLLLFLPWLFAIAVRLLAAYITAFGIVRFEFSISALLQRNLFRGMLTRPGVQSSTGSAGEALNHLRDDTSTVVTLLSSLGEAFALLLYTAVVIGILLHVNILMTMLVFLPLVCILLLGQRAHKSLEKYRIASREATSNVSGAIGEFFSAVQAIQVARAEEHIIRYFDTLNNERRTSMVRDYVFSSSLNALFSNITDIGTALLLLIAAIALAPGQLHPGDLVLFITYLGLATDFFSDFGKLLVQLKQAYISFERMARLVPGGTTRDLVAHHDLFLHGALPARAAHETREIQPLRTLEVKNLSYRYPETGRGISGVNLRVNRGTLTVITGRIGSGKTTLLQTLLGLLPRDEGDIFWNEHPVADPATFFVPPHSAYTAQVPHLFSETLKENILLGLSEQDVDLPKAIHSVVLEPDLSALSQGLETPIGAQGVRLSGGQIQRTAAARMLVRTPELLICDDLSSALDVGTEQILWDRLLAIKTYTCIAVSHRRSLLQRADQVIVLKDGSVEAIGHLSTIIANNAEMIDLWQGQIER